MFQYKILSFFSFNNNLLVKIVVKLHSFLFLLLLKTLHSEIRGA